MDQISLQGFHWLEKYFVELALVFGSASAVQYYDRFHQSILYITYALLQPEYNIIHHILDKNEKGFSTYRNIAKEKRMEEKRDSLNSQEERYLRKKK